jgi:hypothetical protein
MANLFSGRFISIFPYCLPSDLHAGINLRVFTGFALQAIAPFKTELFPFCKKIDVGDCRSFIVSAGEPESSVYIERRCTDDRIGKTVSNTRSVNSKKLISFYLGNAVSSCIMPGTNPSVKFQWNIISSQPVSPGK